MHDNACSLATGGTDGGTTTSLLSVSVLDSSIVDLSPSLPVLDVFYSLIASSLLPDLSDMFYFTVVESDVFALALCATSPLPSQSPHVFDLSMPPLPIWRLSLVRMCLPGELLWTGNGRVLWIWVLLRKLTCLLVRRLWV